VGPGGPDRRGQDRQSRRHLCRLVPEARGRHPADYTDYSYFYDTLTTYGAYWTDDAGNPVNPAQYIKGNDRYSKVSHEIRIATPQENRLRFVGGVFYQRQTHGITQDYKIDALGESISVPGYPHTIWLTKQKRVDRDRPCSANWPTTSPTS
jgi:iron complex outermembrane receptor protein